MLRIQRIDALGRVLISLLFLGALAPALAEEQELGRRWEVTLNLHSWPALGDLRPIAGAHPGVR